MNHRVRVVIRLLRPFDESTEVLGAEKVEGTNGDGCVVLVLKRQSMTEEESAKRTEIESLS